MAQHAPHAPQIIRTTTLDAPIEPVWQALLRPATLACVARGWLSFRPADPPQLPAIWAPGAYRVRLNAHGFLPLVHQVIGIEFPPCDPPRRALRDHGHGSLVRLWDHWISVEPKGDRTLYTDKVQVDAGWMTPLILPWVRAFYAHRQRRWHRLVANGFDTAR